MATREQAMEFLGVSELVAEGISDDDILVWDGYPDWGLYEPQGATRADWEEIISPWWQECRRPEYCEADGCEHLPRDEWIARRISELKPLSLFSSSLA